MKNSNYYILFFLFFIVSSAIGQTEKKALYHPEANAQEDITKLVEQAEKEGKHLVLQVGGNWCGWCIKFHDFIQMDSSINALVNENYLIYHLNYSAENKNESVLEDYQFPQRFGFPVFVILDGKGNRIHTQDSALLESGKGYDSKKVYNFFKGWSPSALNPETYSEKKGG